MKFATMLGNKLTFRAGAEICGLLLGAISMIYLSRIIGPEYIGFNATTSAVLLLVSRLADGGLTALASQRLARDDEKLERLLAVTVAPKLVAAMFLVSLSLLIVNSLTLDRRLAYFLNVSLFMVFFESCTLQWIFIAMGKINVASVMRVGQSVFYMLLILLFIHGGDDWRFLPYLTLANSALNFALSLFFLVRFGLCRVEWSIFGSGYMKSLLGYYREAFHFLKGELSIYVYTSSDRLILYYFTGPAAVGTYEAAYKVINPFYSIAAVITPTMFRDLAQSFKNKMVRPVMARYVFSMSLLTIPLGFFLLFFSREVIHLLYGQRFAASADYLRILGFVITFGFTSGIMVAPFSAWNMAKEFGGSILWGNVLNTALNFSLIPFWGALGAAVATLAAKIVVTVLGYNYFRKATDYPIVRDFLYFFGASVVPLLAVFGLAALWPGRYYLFVVYGAIYLMLAGLLFRYRFKPFFEHAGGA